MKAGEEWSSKLIPNLSNWNAEEAVEARASTGFEPMTSGAMLDQLSYENTLGARSIY